MELSEFTKLRQRVIDNGYGEEIVWQESLKPCDNADDFFGEYMWVILSSGMKNQIARLIQGRIYDAWLKGKPTSSAFRHEGKVKAIDYASQYRLSLFNDYQKAEDKVEYLKGLPWIGDITKWHLAKNLGYDVAKPDRHLVRIADNYKTTPLDLCQKLSKETGYRVATVDLIIWRAANLGYV